MNFPDNIYPASVDPMHYSHVNTLLTASSQLQEPVALIICNNDLKNHTMFSLEERLNIAQNTYHIKDVCIAKTSDEIRRYIIAAKKVIRGIRFKNDMEYIHKLLTYYGLEDQISKGIDIMVPEEMKKISSSKLKELVLEKNIEDAIKYAPLEVIEKIQIKQQYKI